MGDKSKIEWLDGGASWNPITGCTPISEGCANCYAKTMAETRLRGMFGYDQENPFKITFHPEDKLNQPLEWKRPRKIFVCSMGDLFHEDVKNKWLDKIFAVMTKAYWHTFIVLTKRPERMHDYICEAMYDSECRYEGYYEECEELKAEDATPPTETNVWLGVTAENQRTADERIPILLSTPAAKRFVSVEPMLESIDLNLLRNDRSAYVVEDANHYPGYECTGQRSYIDWIICGAETGPNARPMNLDWARNLRDQCAEARVPFFFKKAGPNNTPIPDDLMIREYPKED